MKAWQHGYEIEVLKHVEGHFTDYNQVVLSPFAEMKKNKIATLLHEKKMDIIAEPPKAGHYDDGDTVSYIPTNIAQHAVHIKAFGSVDVGIRQKGERMIDNPVGDKEQIIRTINGYKENLWMVINTEYNLGNEIADEMKFEKVGIKVNSFSDISNVYKRGTNMLVADIPKIEKMNVEKLGTMAPDDIKAIQNKISSVDFANHYSNYNKSKSWSAVALRGYSQDPNMIEKPMEMNDKWQKEHKDDYFVIQDTPLMKEFEPAIGHILKMLPATKERVRLMKLSPNGGILDRHTDQTDKYLGTQDGDIIRLHIPIFTNDKVYFSSWDWNGDEVRAKMEAGELWYLDIRKPHMAINSGGTDRIHLVIDVVANNNIRGMIENVV